LRIDPQATSLVLLKRSFEILISSWQHMKEGLLQRIILSPNIMVGKPVIRGTRIPVELIVRMLAQGMREDDILAEYPRLQTEDIRASLSYAAQTLAHEEVFPIPIST
jgi:uncharacterized protein (DUF433 family)